MTRVGANTAGLSGYPGLAVAILYRARQDVAQGNGYSLDAAAFLRSPWAARLLAGLCDVLGCEYDAGDLAVLVSDSKRTIRTLKTEAN